MGGNEKSAKGYMAKGAPSLSPKGYDDKAARTQENTAKPVKNGEKRFYSSKGIGVSPEILRNRPEGRATRAS